jgi:hypothetical protein
MWEVAPGKGNSKGKGPVVGMSQMYTFSMETVETIWMLIL